VLVRDTKNRSGAVLRFTSAAWRRFADEVKRSLASDLTQPKGLRTSVGGTLVSRVPLRYVQGVSELTRRFDPQPAHQVA